MNMCVCELPACVCVGGEWRKMEQEYKGISSCCSMVVTFIIQTYTTGTNPYVIENVCAEESYIIISCIL